MLSLPELQAALPQIARKDNGAVTTLSLLTAASMTLLQTVTEELKHELALCGFCSRIGLQYSVEQTKNRKRILKYQTGTQTVEQVLENINSNLHKAGSQRPIEAGDLQVFHLVFPFVSFVLSAEQRRTQFKALTVFCKSLSSELAAEESGENRFYQHFLGDERIGNQIDLLPNSLQVRENAEMTTTINQGYKKKQTQRQKEKQNKGKQAESTASHTSDEKGKNEFLLSLWQQFSLSSSMGSAQAAVAEKLKVGANCFESVLTKDQLTVVNELLHACGCEQVEESVQHPAAPTIPDLLGVLQPMLQRLLSGGDVVPVVLKNLFLRGKTKKGEEYFFLVCVPHDYEVKYKALTRIFEAKVGVKFKADVRQGQGEKLEQLLNVKGGSISPLSILFNQQTFSLGGEALPAVHLVLDGDLFLAGESGKEKLLLLHPFTNEATVGIKPGPLLTLLSVAIVVENIILLPTSSSPAASAAPVALTFTDSEGKARLWKKLEAFGYPVVKEDITVLPDYDPKARPKNHSTHNLIVKGKKTSTVYMLTIPQQNSINLKALAKTLKEKELRLLDMKKRDDLLCQTKGCFTLLSLYGNKEGKVKSVIHTDLFDEGAENDEQSLRICCGCDDPLDHTQHRIADVKIKHVKQLVKESNTEPPIYLAFQ